MLRGAPTGPACEDRSLGLSLCTVNVQLLISVIRSPPGLLRPPSLELVPVVLRDPAPALFMRRFKNRRVPVLHPVATHGFATVILLVQGPEAHDVALEVCKGVPPDDGRAARRHPRFHNCIIHRTRTNKVHGGRAQVLDASFSQALFRAGPSGEGPYQNAAATLHDRREAVSTLEDAERIARRVFGRAHPDTAAIEASLQKARAALRARETPSRSA